MRLPSSRLAPWRAIRRARRRPAPRLARALRARGGASLADFFGVQTEFFSLCVQLINVVGGVVILLGFRALDVRADPRRRALRAPLARARRPRARTRARRNDSPRAVPGAGFSRARAPG